MNKSLEFLRRGFLHGLMMVITLALVLPALAPAAAAEEMAAQPVGKEMRCPVCGMYPARYPKWMAQVIFKDGVLRAADSPLDLFRFLHDMAKYDRKHGKDEIAAIYLTDFAKGGWVDAKRAYFVAGSSARGPMNNADLPAFNGREAAEKFAAANGGRVLGFEQITAELIANLEHEGAAHDAYGAHADHGH